MLVMAINRPPNPCAVWLSRTKDTIIWMCNGTEWLENMPTNDNMLQSLAYLAQESEGAQIQGEK